MRRVPANRLWIFGLIAGAGLAWDLYSKHEVFRDLGCTNVHKEIHIPGQHRLFDHPRHVDGESALYLRGWPQFRLYTSFNEGALWGFGQGYTWVFAGLSILAVLGIGYWLFFRGAAESRWLTVALALITAGTLGNLWDRLGLHGLRDVDGTPLYAVRDFLLFTFNGWAWPVFNFADVFLVTGATMLVLQSSRGEAKERGGRLHSKPTPSASPESEPLESLKRISTVNRQR